MHKVVGLYNRYNDKPVWCSRRKKFVTQKINVLSNVDLAIPYTKLDSLAQVVKASKTTNAIDDENDTLTVTIVAMDELSVQMNSRSFKDNFNAYFLNTLLCCRHYHISFYGSAQRFQHVDKLLRDVTHTVIQCHKVWRFQLWASYDAWEMENATNAEMIKPLRSGLWFVLDRDYNAYDTLAVVDNLQKKFEEGDILPESEIISNQAPAGPLGLEVASKPTNKAKRRMYTARSRDKSGQGGKRAEGRGGSCPRPARACAALKPNVVDHLRDGRTGRAALRAAASMHRAVSRPLHIADGLSRPLAFTLFPLY